MGFCAGLRANLGRFMVDGTLSVGCIRSAFNAAGSGGGVDTYSVLERLLVVSWDFICKDEELKCYFLNPDLNMSKLHKMLLDKYGSAMGYSAMRQLIYRRCAYLDSVVPSLGEFTVFDLFFTENDENDLGLPSAVERGHWVQGSLRFGVEALELAVHRRTLSGGISDMFCLEGRLFPRPSYCKVDIDRVRECLGILAPYVRVTVENKQDILRGYGDVLAYLGYLFKAAPTELSLEDERMQKELLDILAGRGVEDEGDYVMSGDGKVVLASSPSMQTQSANTGVRLSLGDDAEGGESDVSVASDDISDAAGADAVVADVSVVPGDAEESTTEPSDVFMPKRKLSLD